MNTISMASFSQQKPILDLMRNTSLKGIKYSPIDSLGKLPEIEVMTNFDTCTVPRVPLGQTTYTDSKGSNHAYPYAFNVASSKIDNTNPFIRDSVHSLVTDQTITGNVHTVLSADFNNKKNVAMETRELQGMGQTSDFNNWMMSSDMISLENNENVEGNKEETSKLLPNVKSSPSCDDMGEIKNDTGKKDSNKDVKETNVEMKDASQKDAIDEEKDKDKNAKNEKKEKIIKPDGGVKKAIDKELLKAYHYFDRNRAGYIKVDDLRRLLHSLGKFLSYKNVKELVSCALFESNKAPRDERIIYPNFLKKGDL